MAVLDVYFSLGSNVGDRESNIMKAITKLDELLESPHVSLSTIIETEPWGFKSDNFLNCAALYSVETDLEPKDHATEILNICKSIETDLGREEVIEYDSSGKRIYHSRTIDIDILYYGDYHIKTNRLTIPHPLIKERDFVLIPLRQIAKDPLKEAFPDVFNIN